MKRYYFYLAIIAFLFLSCSKAGQGDLLEIPINIDHTVTLPLSEIAEEIIAVELEFTDESMLSPEFIRNIIITEKEVLIARMEKIYVFSREGKFIRSIGSKGQGPGEYLGIMRFAFNEKNRQLYINSTPKIISYDINGKFLKETKVFSGVFRDINYFNEELLLLIDNVYNDKNGVYSRPQLYRLNDSLRVIDSCTIMNLYFGDRYPPTHRFHSDYILKGNKSVYLYYGDFTWRTRNNLREKVFSDTLYRFENNHIIPELKLKFKNDEVSNFINLFNIYRSSRYTFVIYNKVYNPALTYFFCFDTKTGKGYNIQDGYTDDINQIKEPVVIRPFNLDTEMFYYLHTHMKPGDLEEPNPTLYIGRLKK